MSKTNGRKRRGGDLMKRKKSYTLETQTSPEANFKRSFKGRAERKKESTEGSRGLKTVQQKGQCAE